MRIAYPLLALAVLAPAVATAEPIAYDGYASPPYASPPSDPDPEHHVQPEGAIGMLVGEYRVGPITGPAFGLHLDAGARYNRIALLGEYDFLSVGQSSSVVDSVRGLVHRVGANLRYSFGVLSKHGFPLRGDFWLEAGAGREWLRWYDGGRLHRNDISLGLAGQLSVRWGDTRHKKVGLYYALKLTAASRPDAKMLPPTCAGPCDAPTGPIPYDLGIFFNFGILFGR